MTVSRGGRADGLDDGGMRGLGSRPAPVPPGHAPLGTPVPGLPRPGRVPSGTPQSGIPTQGGPAFPPGPPRPLGPPSDRLPPLLSPHGRPTPDHPSGEQPPLGDDRRSRLRARGARLLARARTTARAPGGRWTLLGVGAAAQVFLLVSAVLWWTSGSATATATAPPMTWTGIVHDVGAAGVWLRATPTVDPGNTRDTAARGARLAIACGQTGDVVRNGTVSTATWLKTTDGVFVSMLYVRIPDRQSIPSCADSAVDAPLLALSDPTNTDLPPPPGTPTSGDGNAEVITNSDTRVGTGVKARPRAMPAGGGQASAAAPGVAVAPPGQATQAPIGRGTAAETTTAAPTGEIVEDHDDNVAAHTETPVG